MCEKNSSNFTQEGGRRILRFGGLDIWELRLERIDMQNAGNRRQRHEERPPSLERVRGRESFSAAACSDGWCKDRKKLADPGAPPVAKGLLPLKDGLAQLVLERGAGGDDGVEIVFAEGVENRVFAGHDA